jgi:NADH-quinone oxidoreductase subunit L
MKLPLLVLCGLSIAGGFMGIPAFLEYPHHGEHSLNMTVAAISTGAALFGIFLGTLLYAKNVSSDPLVKAFGPVYDFVVKKYYLDEVFVAGANVFRRAAAGVFLWFDNNVVIRKGVNGAASLTAGFGSFLRRANTGFVQSYAMAFGFGIMVIVYFLLMRS